MRSALLQLLLLGHLAPSWANEAEAKVDEVAPEKNENNETLESQALEAELEEMMRLKNESANNPPPEKDKDQMKGDSMMDRARQAYGSPPKENVFQLEGDPLHRFKGALGCSACEMIMTRFKSHVAWKIKGKMDEAARRRVFDKQIAGACDEELYPDELVVGNFKGKAATSKFRDLRQIENGAYGNSKRIKVDHIGEYVLEQLLYTCKYMLHKEYRETLLQKILSIPKKSKASRIDWTEWLCGPEVAKVCDDSMEDLEEDVMKKEL